MPTEQAYTHTAEDFEFEPVQDHHVPVISEWLQRPHVREWWDDPESELADITKMIEDRDEDWAFIFTLSGRAAGYIHCWTAEYVQGTEWIDEEPWIAELDPRTIAIDVFIADETNLSKGIGSSVVRRFAEMLQSEGHDKIIIAPDPANARAVRAYENAGFVAAGEHKCPDGHILKMEYRPTQAGTQA